MKTGTERKGFAKTCEICGKEFIARTSKAKTCSNTCRSNKRHGKVREKLAQLGNVLAREKRVTTKKKRVAVREKQINTREKKVNDIVQKIDSSIKVWEEWLGMYQNNPRPEGAKAWGLKTCKEQLETLKKKRKAIELCS